MVRSARATAAGGAALFAGAVLAGCVTTQEKNARTLLTDARALASEAPVRVTRPDRHVHVLGVEIVGRGRSRAIVVELRSTVARPLTDLPISVGVAARGKRAYLNGAPNTPYYDTHVPLIPASGTTSWVLPAIRVVSGRPFAVVGIPRSPASTRQTTVPAIAARSTGAAGGGALHVSVVNDSAVPQYALQVYAVAARHGRYVGAGRRALAELDGGSRATVVLPIAGTDTNASVALYAPPTIFK